VITLRRADSQPSDAKPAAIAPGGVVLVDSADVACALAARARQASTVILSTDPTTRVDGVIVLGAAENALPDSVRRRLAGAAPHLRVVASACTPQHRWPAPPPEASVRAQEWLVPILRELAPTGDTGSVAALLLTPPLGPHVHPHLALISGFLRSLAHEADYPVLAVVTDATLEDGLDELAAEPFPSPDGTVVHYRRSARYVEQVCPAALPAPAADAPLRVGGEPVVVATGGARGATAAVLTGLARRTRPKLWLLGTTELEPVPSELLDCDEQDVPKVRAGFIRDCRNSRPGTTVAEANRRFDRLLRVREITRNLNRFKQLCGTDRVRYLLCDVTDPDQVGRVARQVYDEDGRVDLLVHGAGRIHSDPVEDKQLGWFRAVRDPKVAGYHNLKTAFRSRPPAVWCNFGSGSGLLGMAGDTDYSPANEYLAAAASYGHVLGRRDEFTIHWPLWTETGMARNQVDLLRQRFGTAAGLTNEQGAAVFLGELARNRPPGTVAVYGLRQGMIPGRHNVTATPDPGSDTVPLLARRTGDRAADPTWVWRPVLPRDRYLLEHVVDGRVIAPAVIMLALCAEAARQVEPAARVVGFRDVVIEEALHFDPRGGEQQFRVTATTGAGGVVVRILSDVVARDGRVLRSDREHLRTEVLLSDTVTAPPRWRASPPPPATPVVQNSATRADSPLHLSGVFETVHDITANGDAVHARWIARVGNDDVLTGLPIPALLIDGLGQLLLHRLDGTQTLPVGVPVGFGRIDLHTTGSDAEVVSRYPCGLDLHFDATADTLSAVSPTGEVLVRITGARIHRFPAIPLRPAEPSTPLAGDR
jgi:NAD(P)-dependent dehydrogenase (short-subunit alcohol dehydrogenase family)